MLVVEKRLILTLFKNTHFGSYLLVLALSVFYPNFPIGWDIWVIPVYMEFIFSFADAPI